MNIHKLASVTFIFTLLAFSISARAAIIDFQQLEHTDALNTFYGYQYVEDGFQLDDLADKGFFTYGTQEVHYTGSTAMYNNADGGVTQLTRVGGGAFDLLSIDLAELIYSNVTDVTFTANTGSSQTFTLDGNAFGAQTFYFNSDFLGVTSVTWSQVWYYHQFDNIKVSSVPVPAAVWLFASGLIGFFGFAKRKKA